jgi:hypothetical protein
MFQMVLGAVALYSMLQTGRERGLAAAHAGASATEAQPRLLDRLPVDAAAPDDRSFRVDGLNRLTDTMQRIGALGRVPVVVGPRGVAGELTSDAAA